MPKIGNKNTEAKATPTLAEYIAQQIAAKRAAALDKSRNRTEPTIPLVERKLSPEEISLRNRIGYAKINQLNDELIQTIDNKQAANIKKEIDKELDNLKKTTTLCQGASCIYTATDNYGKQYRASGNQTFAANPSKYGFKEVSNDSIQPSDIVQFVDRNVPYHAVIYDGKDDKGENLYNYSDGGYEAKNIKIKKHMPGNNYKTYTFVGTPADSTQWINEYKQKYGNSMRCGGRRKAQLGLDIREGGIAIPIASNMYYMNGRSHDNGGIAIGPNNKNGLEVEGGEVVKVGKNDVKVFSSVPFLRGVSPAQLVMGGANPNKVFKAQEEFKDRNRINDDGTKYQNGGEKIYTPSKSIQRQIQETGNITIGGAPTISGLRTFGYLRGLANARKYGAKGSLIFRAGKELIKRGTQKLVDSGKISRNVAQIPRTLYGQFVGVHGQNFPKTINLFTDNDKKEYGGMIYTINGNVKNGLMSARPKAKYGLATKYLKKKNKSTEKPVETKQKEEPKILDIRNTAGYKVKQIAENPWIKYPIEVASYLLTGATAKGMQTGAKVTSKAINKIDDILGKPRQEYLSRNISDKTIQVGTLQNPIRPGDAVRTTKIYKPTHTEIIQARQASRPKPEIRKPSIDKAYKKSVGSKEPRSTVGNRPQWTEITYNPIERPISAYDASVEFHKRISDMIYNSMVKKYGKKGVDKAMKAEGISKYKMGGRVKAEGGKFLKYKNGVFTDPESGEEYDVDPEVFKMKGNSFESGIIPINENYTTSNYYYGSTFNNNRPQYYAEKRLPIAGSQSIAEKAGLARSGWSYSDDYISVDDTPKVRTSSNIAKGSTGESYVINPLTGEWIRNGVTETSEPSIKGTTKVSSKSSSTPRGGVTKVSTPKAATKTTTKGADVKYGTPLKEKKESVYMTGIKNNVVTPIRAAMEKVKSPSSTGGGTQSKDGRWIGQYKTTNVGDLIGLGSNLAGSVASYFMTKNAIDKTPDPIKPVMAQPIKLKTRYNIEPQLTNTRESEQVNRAAVRRNTQSSNTSLAREQRLMNEARGVRNQLYGQKENIETQLINQDRLNRQSVMRDNVKSYNEYLNKVSANKTVKNQLGISNINNLLTGLTGSVNNILGTIESRRATNNTLRAIAAANPNVDARLIGGFDYYIDPITKRKYNKNQQYVGTING